MSNRKPGAYVKPYPHGGWVALCREHEDFLYGSMAEVDMWADIHNDDKHKDVPDE